MRNLSSSALPVCGSGLSTRKPMNTLTVGERRFALVANGLDAWASDAPSDRAIVAGLSGLLPERFEEIVDPLVDAATDLDAAEREALFARIMSMTDAEGCVGGKRQGAAALQDAGASARASSRYLPGGSRD